MNYYIHNGIIHITEATLDYNQLNDNQIEFYLSNPNASEYEIINCKLNEEFVQSNEDKIETLSFNYAEVERQNLTPAGLLLLKQYADNGIQKAIDNLNWLVQLYNERDEKIVKIMNNEDVILYVSENLIKKPFSLFEINQELKNK